MTSAGESALSIVIAIPAHNESATIGGCIESVVQSARLAQRLGVVERVVAVVAAHRCTDDTALVAERGMAAVLDGEIVTISDHADVGTVRDLAIARGLAVLGAPAARTWIFSTDADTMVSRDWITRTIREAADAEAVCVAGLADVLDWDGSTEARLTYNEILASKMYDDEAGRPSHGHVYGANLAIRADAYQAVGGFPAIGHGEDQRLVDSLVGLGFPVLRTRTTPVRTSGRTVGRARDGLADLLRRLDSDTTNLERRPDIDAIYD